MVKVRNRASSAVFPKQFFLLAYLALKTLRPPPGRSGQSDYFGLFIDRLTRSTCFRASISLKSRIAF